MIALDIQRDFMIGKGFVIGTDTLILLFFKHNDDVEIGFFDERVGRGFFPCRAGRTVESFCRIPFGLSLRHVGAAGVA